MDKLCSYAEISPETGRNDEGLAYSPPRWYRQGNSKLESIRFVEQVVSSLDETD